MDQLKFNFSVYQGWDLYPIIAVYCVGMLVWISLTLVSATNSEGGQSYMYAVGKITFRDALERKEKEDGFNYFFFGYRCKKRILFAISFMSTMLWLSMFATFWAVFLIEESFGCDEKIDCFPFRINSSNSSNQTIGLLQDYPIEDCSEFILNDEVEIQCFAFVLRYAEGLGAAGGILLIASTIVEGYMVFLISCVKRAIKSESPFCLLGILYAWCFFIMLMPIVIVIVTISVPVLRKVLFATWPSGIQYFSYFFAIYGCLMTSILLLKDIKFEETNNTNDDSPQQPLVEK